SLSPAGAQTTQLLVGPPWTPAVLWDRVTLTCQGSGTPNATIWYKDGQRWWPEGLNHFIVTAGGTYQCYRPDTRLSPNVSVLNDPPGVMGPPCPMDRLVLQVPARTLLEGDTVTLYCRV
ncbi:FCGR3 protein, partial [Menura novaehollandiae]|nr:FCGR3 protein [Menura novaehollandiae]